MMKEEEIRKVLSETDSLEEIFDEHEITDEEQINIIMEKFGINMDDLDRVFTDDLPKVPLQIKKINEVAIIPSFAYETDSGFDLFSVDDYTIEPFGRELISTGIVINVPENHEIQIRSKSGIALKQGLFVLNSPGTIDQGYTGEIKVILFNTNNEIVKINKGTKIAQAVVCPVVCGRWIDIIEVKEVQNKDRMDNGFGSTGV